MFEFDRLGSAPVIPTGVGRNKTTQAQRVVAFPAMLAVCSRKRLFSLTLA